MANLSKISPFDEAGNLRVVVESPRASSYKLVYQPKLKAFVLDRPLAAGVVYPFDWGFVPGTRAADGDPLDALVLTDVPLSPGVIVPARPLGVVQLSEKADKGGRERNDRLIATPIKTCGDWLLEDVEEVPKRLRSELEQFFVSAVLFEGKQVHVEGWADPTEALRLVKETRLKRS